MSDLKDFKNMGEEEQRDAMLDYGRKLDQTVGTKIRTAMAWFFRIIGGLLLLIGLIVVLWGHINPGMGLLGGGLMVFGMGLKNISFKVKRITMGIGVILLGLAFLNYGLGQRKKSEESVNWPSVSGKIISSELEERTSTEGSGNSKRKVTYHVAIIKYAYHVDNTSYDSNRITFGGQDRSRSGELVSTYPKEKSVSVFYNPDNPKEAVLEPGMHNAGYFFPIFGGFIALTGLLFVYTGFKK